jgi:hypothetical protein
MQRVMIGFFLWPNNQRECAKYKQQESSRQIEEARSDSVTPNPVSPPSYSPTATGVPPGASPLTCKSVTTLDKVSVERWLSSVKLYVAIYN